MIHSVSPSLTSQYPARPPWRAQHTAHATKQTFWLVNTNTPITPLAGSLSSCTDGPISRKFWLSSYDEARHGSGDWPGATCHGKSCHFWNLFSGVHPLSEACANTDHCLAAQTSIIAVSSHKNNKEIFRPGEVRRTGWAGQRKVFSLRIWMIGSLRYWVVIVMLHWTQEMFQSFHSGSRQVISL